MHPEVFWDWALVTEQAEAVEEVQGDDGTWSALKRLLRRGAFLSKTKTFMVPTDVAPCVEPQVAVIG